MLPSIHQYLVGSVPAERVLVNVPRELDVSTPAVKLLLVLHGELQDEILTIVREGFAQLRRQTVEPGGYHKAGQELETTAHFNAYYLNNTQCTFQ